jgi:hypothetical protein
MGEIAPGFRPDRILGNTSVQDWTYTQDDVLSDRSALTRYRVSADERAPRKPAETDDIACPPSNTQDMTAVRPPSNLCITPIEVYAIFACLFRIRAECWVSNRRKSRKFSVECSPGRGIVLNIHLNGSAVHRMTFCTAQAVHFSAGYDAVGNTTSPPRTTPWVITKTVSNASHTGRSNPHRSVAR